LQQNGWNWKRMRFKGNKVWVALDENGKPFVKEGKWRIKYQLEQEYEYWVRPQGVKPLSSSKSPAENKDKIRPTTQPFSVRGATNDNNDKDTICIYTDGASSGNPGPSGIGVVIRYQGMQKEISRFIGTATNNYAELEAIRVALEQIKNKNLPVRIFTDSNYAYGVLALGWKARKNRDLIEAIKKNLRRFKDIEICKIKGHADEAGNIRADLLATSAVTNAD